MRGPAACRQLGDLEADHAPDIATGITPERKNAPEPSTLLSQQPARLALVSGALGRNDLIRCTQRQLLGTFRRSADSATAH